jgi:acyl-CoA synthetase (AMP-forming)/AMP-acid ligase II
MVRDAVALGVEDPKLGQHVLLVVAARDSLIFHADELLSALRRALPLYMVPESIVVVDEIPRSPNGKFDRARLRDELAS